MKLRRALFGGIAAVGFFMATVAWQRIGHVTFPFGRVEAQEMRPADVFNTVSSRPIDGYQAAAISSDGTYVGLISGPDGRVTLLKMGKRTINAWTRRVSGVTDIAVSAGARNVVLYSSINPSNCMLTILKGSTGALVSQTKLDGPIWDVSLSDDGCFAGIVTSNRTAYLYTLGDKPVAHQWPLSGAGNSVAFTRNSSYVVTGTWDESGVNCYTRTGESLWQYPISSDDRKPMMNRIFEAHTAQNGQYIMGLSYGNVRQSDAKLYFWRGTGTGKPIWTHSFAADAFYPKAQISADGRFVAVTYLHVITHGSQSVTERRLMVLDSYGNVVLQNKGGLLFSPNLITLAPDGHCITVSDGQKALYHLNGDGRITASWTAPGLIRQTMPSTDGRYVLVYSGDGTLTLLSLRSPNE